MLWSAIVGIVKWAFIAAMGLVGVFVTLWLVATLIWPGNLWGQPVWSAARDLVSGMFEARPVFGSSADDIAKAAAAALQPDKKTLVVAPQNNSSSTTHATADSTNSQGTVPSTECKAIDEYEVQVGATAISSGDGSSWIHSQLWSPGFPEYESALDAGTYQKRPDVAGHVWLYPSSCTKEQVMKQVSDSIKRRQLQGANNGGYVDPSWYFDQGWLSR